MSQLFIHLHRYFDKHKFIFGLFFICLISVMFFFASRIKIIEDISGFFPDDKKAEKLNFVYRHSAINDRTAIMITFSDSLQQPEPDSLVQFAEKLLPELEDSLGTFLKKIVGRVDEEKVLNFFEMVSDHLPVFLNESDYVFLDSLCEKKRVAESLQNSYNQLISPSGIVTKRVISKDPLGISFRVLGKLRQLQFDENFELYDGFIITKDQRNILLFLQSNVPAADTKRNEQFVYQLNNLMIRSNAESHFVQAIPFGASLVAVGNAEQIRKDSFFTLSIMIVLLIIFVMGYFRKLTTPFIILLPALFGALFSIACISLFKGSVSVLAIAAGSVILGIAVNYSLHFLTHLKYTGSIEKVIADLTMPLTVGSATTVLAFLSLQFANSAVLRDVGLFAGLSLIGAALCSLIFLPGVIQSTYFNPEKYNRTSWMDRIALRSFEKSNTLLILLVVFTIIFAFFAGNVQFNSDMNKLNFMTADLKKAERKLEGLNEAALRSTYVIAEAANLEDALRMNEKQQTEIDRLKSEGSIVKFSSVSAFLISDSLQKIRIDRWNEFWTEDRKQTITKWVEEEGNALHFSGEVISNFNELISKDYHITTPDVKQEIQSTFFNDFVINEEGKTVIVTPLNVDASKRDQLYSSLGTKCIPAFDRQMLANLFIENARQDFTLIVSLTALIVFFALLLVYGRIELTIISFLPMFITWIWILGIMALLGIEFNIVNVIVSTFIFGLGDDFCIFTMDGLQQDYQYKRNLLPSVRVSILLSVLTTIAGLGVLIFAKHPAMRSIASISIIGILCVFVMSQTLAPFLYRKLITSRAERGLSPMTFFGILRTALDYTFFVAGALLLTIFGFLLKFLPLNLKFKKRIFCFCIMSFCRIQIFMDPLIKKKFEGIDKDSFKNPAVIIANHSSFLDILLCIMLNQKLILFTNKWVYNSPVFGGVVRLAGYFAIKEGAENSIEHFRNVVADGYSVVVFPEGSRSKTGKINRFHKGAFYLAEQLKIPIRPLMIHGASDCVSKNTFYMNSGTLSLKMLPLIAPTETSYGDNYAERTKRISAQFKSEYAVFKAQRESGKYFSKKLISNFLYKGPVVEWYLRIKIMQEGYYEMFEKLVPRDSSVLDMGCGYGFMSYMLHFRSPGRTIIAIDYDEEKIETAKHCFSKTDQITFIHGDIVHFEFKKYDVIILADALHYLNAADQDKLVINAFKALNPGGKLIIRDGDSDLTVRHKGTKLTEFFSVKLLGFNKATNNLQFVSGNHLRRLAVEQGMDMNILDETSRTSNVVFVFSRPILAPQ